jgi:hypothetical protein
MASMALDFTTIGRALKEFERVSGDSSWVSCSTEQAALLKWLDEHQDTVLQLTDLWAKASPDHRVLNAFLREHKFPEMFDPLEGGVGVVAILDMLVNWLVRGRNELIQAADGNTYPGFKLDSSTAKVCDVAGYESPLVALKTTTGHTVWLMEAPEPDSGLDLALHVQKLLESPRFPRYSGDVVVPKIDLDLKPNIDWLCRLSAVPSGWFVDEAFQLFKLRMNEIGARVKVATGITMRVVSLPPEPYIFTRPFMGFFTQPDHANLALAAFWADYDVWREPEGTLEEL